MANAHIPTPNELYWDESCDRCGKRRGSHFAVGHGKDHQCWCPGADGKRDPNSLGWLKGRNIKPTTPVPPLKPLSIECPCGINRKDCEYHK